MKELRRLSRQAPTSAQVPPLRRFLNCLCRKATSRLHGLETAAVRHENGQEKSLNTLPMPVEKAKKRLVVTKM